MKLSRTINYICIIAGGLLALYAQSEAEQNTYLLLAGLVLLVFGIYRTSSRIPSKYENEAQNDESSHEND